MSDSPREGEPIATSTVIIANLVQLTKAFSPEERKSLLEALGEAWCIHCGHNYNTFKESHYRQKDGTMAHYVIPVCYCQADD